MTEPQWIRDEVISGLQALVALRLQGTPPADTIVLTSDIWVKAFCRIVQVEELDRPRIKRGFEKLFPEVREWPAPNDVIRLMPSRPPQPSLPAPDPGPKVEEEYRQCRPLLDGLVEKMTLPQERKPPTEQAEAERRAVLRQQRESLGLL